MFFLSYWLTVTSISITSLAIWVHSYAALSEYVTESPMNVLYCDTPLGYIDDDPVDVVDAYATN